MRADARFPDVHYSAKYITESMENATRTESNPNSTIKAKAVGEGSLRIIARIFLAVA